MHRVTRTAEGQPRNGLQALSPQGGESSGWAGICLVQLETHHSASQVSLLEAMWERGCIIKCPGMGHGLMRWMKGD